MYFNEKSQIIDFIALFIFLKFPCHPHRLHFSPFIPSNLVQPFPPYHRQLPASIQRTDSSEFIIIHPFNPIPTLSTDIPTASLRGGHCRDSDSHFKLFFFCKFFLSSSGQRWGMLERVMDNSLLTKRAVLQPMYYWWQWLQRLKLISLNYCRASLISKWGINSLSLCNRISWLNLPFTSSLAPINSEKQKTKRNYLFSISSG